MSAFVRVDAFGVPVDQRARQIARLFGVRAGAEFMRLHGWTLDAALWTILGVATRSER